MFDRGFTGHEHLPQFGLINMNGRVYDPFLARFLSPDPYVQAPDYSQNFNRYSYAFNNPLKYTDPDGEWVHLVVGAVIGGFVNWAANGAEFSAKGLGHFGVGALAGALGAGIGAGFGTLAAGSGSFGFMVSQGLTASGFGAGAAAGAGAGFSSGLVTGAGNSLLNGEDFSSALSEGLRSASIGGITGGLTGGISGGIRATKFGNDFWSGNGAGGRYGAILSYERASLPSNSSYISYQCRNFCPSKLIEPDRYYLNAERFVETENSTISNFCFPDGTDGYFLEPSGPSSRIEGSGLRISSGVYEVGSHNSTKFPNSLILKGVPGRSAILMHPGNYPCHTSGCLLPGLGYGTDQVNNSRDALNLLLELHRNSTKMILNIN